MRAFPITSAKGGMNRLRNKGGAEKDSFYTLKNCYVTSSRSVVPRPGTAGDEVLPTGGGGEGPAYGLTKGLMAFRGILNVFSAEPVTLTNPIYNCITLQHPDGDSTARLKEIHFAQPFLGYPYVVAEFDDDPTKFYHYWLEETGVWEANTVYPEYAVIQPTVENGYTYRATRLTPAAPVWGPLEPRAIGDFVEPTTPNGYQYEVIDTVGPNPLSGSTEPAWIASTGALVYEDGNASSGPSGGDAVPPLPPDVSDRYKNQGGSAKNYTGAGDT